MDARALFTIAIVACASPVPPRPLPRAELPHAELPPPLPALDPLPVGVSDPAYRLPRERAFYFAQEGDVGARFIELRANGTYRTVDREHLGVGEDDAGRWRQAESGELHLCSEYRYGNIEAGPLWIVVATTKQYKELPEVARTLRSLTAKGAATFSSKDIEWPLSHGEQDYQHPSINNDAYGRDITRAEIDALARVIDAYMVGGNENLMRTVPRAHGEVVYLDGSWELPHTVHDEGELALIHRRLDAKEHTLWALPSIDEPAFRTATHRTQSFIIHTEMNGCVQHEVAELPDWKKEHLTPRCRLF
jgi:hypothetical protein